MKILSNSDFDFEPLCLLLGQYFQINDDYLNLTDDRFQKMKGKHVLFSLYARVSEKMKTSILKLGFAEDITKGKYSFLVIHFKKIKNI